MVILLKITKNTCARRPSPLTVVQGRMASHPARDASDDGKRPSHPA